MLAHYVWGALGDPARNYKAMIVLDAPVAYWRLGEATGTNSPDETDNDNDITWISTPTQGQDGAIFGDTDKAVAFAGAQYGLMPSDSSTTPAAVSVEAWIKRSAAASKWEAIVDRYGSANGYFLGFNDVGQLVWSLNGGLGLIQENYPTDGEWHHVVATYLYSSGMYLYIDGVEVGTQAYATGINYSSVRANVGFVPTVGYLIATLDDLAIYDRSLSAGEVLAHYNLGAFGPPITGGRALDSSHPLYENILSAAFLDQGSGDEVQTLTGSVCPLENGAWEEGEGVVFSGNTRIFLTDENLPDGNYHTLVMGFKPSVIANDDRLFDTDTGRVTMEMKASGELMVWAGNAYRDSGLLIAADNEYAIGMRFGAASIDVIVDSAIAAVSPGTATRHPMGGLSVIGNYYGASTAYGMHGLLRWWIILDRELTDQELADLIADPEAIYTYVDRFVVLGEVTLDGDPVEATLYLYDSEDGTLVETTTSSASTGSYPFGVGAVTLSQLKQYYVMCSYPGDVRPLAHGPVTPAAT